MLHWFFTLIGGMLIVLSLYIIQASVAYPWVYRLRSKYAKCGSVPVERSFPLGIRHTLRAVKGLKTNTFFPMFDELVQQYGPTVLCERLNRWIVFTNEPENIKAILATKFLEFDLGAREEQVSPAFGSGIFTVSGERWKHSRQMLRPQFSRQQVSQLKSVQKHCEIFIGELLKKQRSQMYVDVQEMFHELTMDTATEFLFGQSVNSLVRDNSIQVIAPNGDLINTSEFIKSYTFMADYTRVKMLSGPSHKLLNSREFRNHIVRAEAFIDYFVRHALDAPVEKESDAYYFSHELAKVSRDPMLIRSQCLNILIAGRDTTAVTMAFSIFYLATRPEMYAELRNEVQELFPDGQPITFEGLRGTRLLNMFINEVLRLCPVVPVNMRYAVKDTSIPRGGGPDGSEPVFIPKGVGVQYSVFKMHRDEKFWGEDALEFRPSRWAEGKTHQWDYLPFNGGPRICLGQQFALTEASLTLVRLLKRFSKLEAPPGFPADPVFSVALTLRSGIPVSVRFTE